MLVEKNINGCRVITDDSNIKGDFGWEEYTHETKFFGTNTIDTIGQSVLSRSTITEKDLLKAQTDGARFNQKRWEHAILIAAETFAQLERCGFKTSPQEVLKQVCENVNNGVLIDQIDQIFRGTN